MQRLCKINIVWIAFWLIGLAGAFSYHFNDFFGISSGFLSETFGISRRTPEEPMKKLRSHPEADTKKSPSRYKKNFAEALHTLCNWGFLAPHLCFAENAIKRSADGTCIANAIYYSYQNLRNARQINN